MARERVQVQGLGGAVPGISPTIQRGGQYSVQVQQAGRNKLMDLADALGQVNPMLQQYTRVADIEAEQFEEELAGKSPEEVQAMLKQTEGELDKQVRRGGMGWLTSPLNQKRKLKAVGQASSRLLMEQVYGRLESPQAGDEDLSTSDIIAQVQQDFVGNSEALNTSKFAQEGLQEAVNPQILPLVRQYDAQKNRIAKAENGVSTVSGFYDLIDNLKGTPEGLAAGDIASGRYTEEFNKIWDNTNAHTPAEQRVLFKQILFNLADQGHEDEAQELRVWAEDNKLKFGNASMSELERDQYDDFIDDTAEQAGSNREKKKDKAIEEISAEAMQALRDIRNPNKRYGEFQGITNITTERQLDEAVEALRLGSVDEEEIVLGNVEKEQLIKGFYSNKARAPDPVKEARDRSLVQIRRDSINTFFEPTSTAYVGSSIANSLAASYPNVADVIESNPEIIQEAYSDLILELGEEAERLAAESSDYDIEKITISLRPIARKLFKEKQQEMKQSFREAAETDDEKTKILNTATQSVEDEKVIEDTVWDQLKFWKDDLTTTVKVKNYTSVLSNKEIKELKERKKALRLLKDVDFDGFMSKAFGRVPMEMIKKAGGGEYETITMPRFATVEEQLEMKNTYKAAAVHLGLYTDLETLVNKTLPAGLLFNPEALDPKFIPILTKEEIDKGAGDAAVKEKARLVGKEDEVLDFYNQQKELQKQYRSKKYTYPSL
jgi:hypothetical protein